MAQTAADVKGAADVEAADKTVAADVGVKSNILLDKKLRNDFNATAAHVKDMVNQTATLKNPPWPSSCCYGQRWRAQPWHRPRRT